MQLFGHIQNMDVTTMLFYGLTGPRGQWPITSRAPDDHIIDEDRTKIQGGVEHKMSTAGLRCWTSPLKTNAKRQPRHHGSARPTSCIDIGEVEQEGGHQTELLVQRVVYPDANWDEPRDIGRMQIRIQKA